jgi:toxin-antitoxin system PIN domain toxin
MVAVDTNILVYAFNTAAPEHEPATRALLRLSESPAWGIPWIAAAEFMAVVTNPRLWNPTPTADDAVAALDVWLDTPGARLLGELPSTWTTFRELATHGRVQGRKVHDARIAAVCLDHGVSELWSLDRDFSWFPQLRVVNPLVG